MTHLPAVAESGADGRPPAAPARPGRLRALGWIGVASGVVGVVMGLVVFAWPAQVPDTQYSYPQAPGPFVVTEILFVLRHLGMLAGLVGVVLLVRPTANRATRIGLGIALAGNALMVFSEASTLPLAHEANDSPAATPTFVLYGASVIAMGAGLVVAGIGIARTRALPGAWGRWITLVQGVWIFLILPLMAMNTLSRIALSVWLLLWAVQSLALINAVASAPSTNRRPKKFA